MNFLFNKTGKISGKVLLFVSTLVVTLITLNPLLPRNGVSWAQTETQTEMEKEAVESEEIVIEVFWSVGCPHCAEERQFLRELSKIKEDIVIKEYEISRNRENALLMREYGEQFSTNSSGVPFTVINGEDYVAGFGSPETTGLAIINKTREIQGKEPYKSLNEFLVEEKNKGENEEPSDESNSKGDFSFLFFKNIDLESVSLPFLTVVLALADGFNPCAMWVLLFLISLLLGMENKRRRWIIGGTFILASGLVYFLFLTAWLKFFLFIGYVQFVRYLIGAVALIAAFIYIRDVIRDPEGCKVVGGNEKRKMVFSKLREFVLRDNLLVALGGIVLLAFAVNLVELLCSAGLPATYSNILAMNDLSMLSYYGYMALYVLIFMIDDFVVFAIAMITLHAVGLESKYARCAHLIGGLLMLFIGLSMLLKPELLMFG